MFNFVAVTINRRSDDNTIYSILVALLKIPKVVSSCAVCM